MKKIKVEVPSGTLKAVVYYVYDDGSGLKSGRCTVFSKEIDKQKKIGRRF